MKDIHELHSINAVELSLLESVGNYGIACKSIESPTILGLIEKGCLKFDGAMLRNTEIGFDHLWESGLLT